MAPSSWIAPRTSGVRPAVAACLSLAAPVALSAPWIEAGDPGLRSDLETLAASGVIDNLTTQWPVPWRRIAQRLADEHALDGQPPAVVEAAQRLKDASSQQIGTHLSMWADATNAPNPVRGFDALGRQQGQGQLVLDSTQTGTSVHVAVGAQSHDVHDRQTLMLDGTYVATELWGAGIYAGWVTHWWGPGWISALSQSNNARPIPQLGITRLGSSPLDFPVLRWLGPWQAEFFIGVLDGPRIDHHTILDGLRFSFNPLPGFEWGFARLDQACGEHHPCVPLAYFNARNDDQHPSITNSELDLDFKYLRTVGPVTLSAYMQLMNEDSNPIYRSGTSHVFGLTAWVPAGGTRVRLTAEYTSTVPTSNIFSFGQYSWGFAYNDYKYPDGLRYRGRALGFSLDSNSKLSTLQAQWLGAHDIQWTLTYHHAKVADMRAVIEPGTGFVYSTINPVSTAPVVINIGEVRARVPLNERFSVDAAVRYQDDQLRPAQGAQGAFEAQLNYQL